MFRSHHLGIPTSIARPDVLVAFVVHNGAPVELMEIQS
jgi:hypothetical protein